MKEIRAILLFIFIHKMYVFLRLNFTSVYWCCLFLKKYLCIDKLSIAN